MLVGLDVGSAVVKVVVARARRPGLIIGAGISPSAGISKGKVVDAQAAGRSLAEALKQAAAMARVKINKVCLGISGGSVQAQKTRARVVFKKRRVIRRKDIEHLNAAAGAFLLPPGRQVIQILPQEFCTGSFVTARPPFGEMVDYLECRAIVITADQELIKQLSSILNLLGVKVTGVVCNALAAARITLGEVEKQLGVAIVDLGSSATGVGLFKNGALLGVNVLPVGSAHITSDLAIGLGTSLASAEVIKRQCGLSGDRQCAGILPIIRARVEEMFSLWKEEIEEKIEPGALLPCGIVLTGGGALLKGLPEAAAQRFGVPVRVGSPQVNKFPAGIDPGPVWCASVGLTAGEQN